MFCPFCNNQTLITSFNMTMQDVTFFVCVKTFESESHSRSSFAGINHRICHQLNIYRMNSVNVFATVIFHGSHFRSCVTLLQEVVTHITELHKLPYCMAISATTKL